MLTTLFRIKCRWPQAFDTGHFTAMTQHSPTQLHSPPPPGNLQRPKGIYYLLVLIPPSLLTGRLGILKNSYHSSPPQLASASNSHQDVGHEISDKDLTLANTLQNAGHRHSSSSTSRAAGSR